MTMYAECGQCGWMGPLSEVGDHPTRPMPTDFGFCPKCHHEVDGDYFDIVELERRLAEYE